ncbi:MAG: hypothetical protein QOE82_1404 [Thermoanaerobaculia bacterium]|jgi:hypothetical protein|nr:hypothetical protein [Thermoanaerobaculia bacterium]
MSAALGLERIDHASPRWKTGAFYLITALTAAAFFFRLELVVARHASGQDFEAEIIGIACRGAVTAILYTFLKPASRGLSLGALFAGLFGCAVQVFASSIYLASRAVVVSARALGVDRLGEVHRFVNKLLLLHTRTSEAGLVIFGLYCIMAGCLIFSLTALPRIVGLLMAFAGFAHIVGGVGSFLSATRPDGWSWIPLCRGFAEASLMLFLLAILSIRRPMCDAHFLSNWRMK